jgi:hypothetical protein
MVLSDKPTEEELSYIAERLPEKTLREFGAFLPLAAAKGYVEAAEAAYVVYLGGAPAVCLGVAKEGFVWVVATREGLREKRGFMLATRELLARTLGAGRHAYVWAVIPLWYKETVRWCRWLGARFHDEVDDPNMGRSVIITFNLADVVLGRGHRDGNRAGDRGGAVSDLRGDRGGEGAGRRLEGAGGRGGV